MEEDKNSPADSVDTHLEEEKKKIGDGEGDKEVTPEEKVKSCDGEGERRASTGGEMKEGNSVSDGEKGGGEKGGGEQVQILGRRDSQKKEMDTLQEPEYYVPMRKQSSGDLQSRLKTRKLLGVGENEDGSVPLSKISQILGHDDHYLINLPAGLRLWQVTTAVAFTAIAILAMCFPIGLFETVFVTSCGQESVLPIRLFGGAITCLSLLYWSAIRSVSRHIIRWTLLTEILYLSIQTLVMFCSLLGSGTFSFSSLLVLGLFLMGIAISMHFYATLSGISSKWLWATYQAITQDLTGGDKND